MKNKTVYQINQPETWQSRFNSKEESWNDLARMGRVIILPSILFAYVLLYSIMYIGFFLSEAKGGVIDSSVAILKIIAIFIFPFLLVSVGLRVVFKNSDKLLREFYKLPDETKTSPLIRLRLLGITPLPPPLNSFLKYPFIVLDEPKLKEKDDWVRWLGGPANLIIYDGIALYLERGNSFSRVVGPGMPVPFLERHERIRSIVDLRPQTLPIRVNNFSKDGIEVCLDLRLVCQIKYSEQALAHSKNLVYPFDPIEVRKAVERMTVKCDSKTGKMNESEWLDGLLGRVSGKFSAYITSHRLDELFVEFNRLENNRSNSFERDVIHEKQMDGNAIAEKEGQKSHIPYGDQTQILSSNALQKFIDDLNNNLLKDEGCRVLILQILSIQVPQNVTNERFSYWQAEREKIAHMRQGKSDADQIRIKELAGMDAQRDILQSIAKSLEKVDESDFTNSLFVSFSSILNQNIEDPFSRAYFAIESPEILKNLQKILSDEPAQPKGEKNER